jgi:hypothetical protein
VQTTTGFKKRFYWRLWLPASTGFSPNRPGFFRRSRPNAFLAFGDASRPDRKQAHFWDRLRGYCLPLVVNLNSQLAFLENGTQVIHALLELFKIVALMPSSKIALQSL